MSTVYVIQPLVLMLTNAVPLYCVRYDGIAQQGRNFRGAVDILCLLQPWTVINSGRSKRWYNIHRLNGPTMFIGAYVQSHIA